MALPIIIEESLVNAYYHRRYDEYQPVEVNIMPDMIEIISYGGAERSIKLDDLRAGKRDVTDNDTDVTDNVTDNVTENGTDVTENVTDISTAKKRREEMLRLMTLDKKITTDNLANILHVSRRTIARDINLLRSQNRLMRDGDDYGGSWVVM